ncbi:IclR family transcriptional regulator domain-containing protein [Inquilinus limosus]|uniref:IclR family transcriptional regulator domain-containing protein n=1 Tax=Inquilinus limosus TaxID=171674 RepID=UPI003F5CBD57
MFAQRTEWEDILRDEQVVSFRKGLEIIRSFGAGHRRQTITEAASRTGMTRAAARRFLLTLCEAGYARSDGKHFELTPAILTLGHSFLSGMGEIERVRDALLALTRGLGESASAAMLDGTMITYVARSPAAHRIMTVGLGVGTRLPAHATSMGQALLAALHPRELERYFEAAVLERFTEHTLTTRAALTARLAEVRGRGYALVSEELETGLRSIAVAVPGGISAGNLAINMSAPAGRVGAEEMRERFLPALREAAQAIALAVQRS